MAQEFITKGGIDQARSILERALGTQKAIDIVNRLTSSLQVRPFDFVRRQDPSQLLNFIQNEHPQTISLIPSYLIQIKWLASFRLCPIRFSQMLPGVLPKWIAPLLKSCEVESVGAAINPIK